MKAIIVTRFSDEKQRGNTSTEVQEQTCRAYCESNGFAVVGIKRFEAESAKATNTERIRQLLEFCKKYKGKADILVVYKLSRFARDVALHYFLKSQLLKLNLSLHSATELINNTAAGKLTENMIAAFAQFENDSKAESTVSAGKTKCSHGVWPWKAPLGYTNVKNAFNKADVAQINEPVALHVRNIFNMYANGRMGIVEISKEMQKHIITTKKGKRIKFSPQTVHNILTNKFYIGILEVKKWKEHTCHL